ncbi:hypothetical protein [Ktedonobacter racemifer]|uniref:Uncharacterized protein n=1 Tax=Ktedonobacter racemifer DSM 44963 TaxID=485913 RepID=D6TNN6_KTERA|nr:hypothetical protein [Ktedonobacter racemifer]EFH87367.1 hypothetical protein Krac_8698 [Ktedonobacter racemifer DSM 44963]
MQTLPKPDIKQPDSGSSGPLEPLQRRKKSGLRPVIFVSIALLLLTLLAGAFLFFGQKRIGTHAAAANANCTLTVPANPLSAQGLATPYQLQATDPNAGPCNEANADQAAFVQGAVFDPATGKISIYNPLVVDAGTQPAVAPAVPTLPQNAIVGLWFGYNGDVLTLKGQGNSLRQGRCVNGLFNNPFGQFAYCNAPTFFGAANQAIRQGKLVVPPIGQGSDGQPCPTVRDFFVVDQDQSDNVTSVYLANANGQTAQMNPANAGQLQGAQTLVNASDNRLVSVALDGALGCTSWMAPDLAAPGQMAPALPLNELQAAKQQAQPAAIIPVGDPMVLNNGKNSLAKLNLYRLGVDQPFVLNADRGASTKQYCINLLNIQPPRLQNLMNVLQQKASPMPDVASNLFTFMAQRFNTTWGADGGLNCQSLLNMSSPIQTQTDGNGVTISATINLNNNGGQNGAAPTQPAAPTSTAGAAPTPANGNAQPTPPADNAGATPTPNAGNGTPQPTPPADSAGATPTPGQ